MFLKLMYITNSLEVALIAQKCGVERIWIDLETLGKEDRQKGLDSVQSRHTIDDIRKIKPHLTSSKMLVRVNHWYNGSPKEIDDVIAAGADIIMLPYWKTVEEVNLFLKAVNGRCKTILLLETKEAVECVDEILKMGGFDEIHIGLNDLHLSYGMTFMFELLTNGMVETLCNKFKKAGIPYGFGGIARLGHGDLRAERVIIEHYRLGSTRAILSRSFCNANLISNKSDVESLFKTEMKRFNDFSNKVLKMSDEAVRENHKIVKQLVAEIVEKRIGDKV